MAVPGQHGGAYERKRAEIGVGIVYLGRAGPPTQRRPFPSRISSSSSCRFCWIAPWTPWIYSFLSWLCPSYHPSAKYNYYITEPFVAIQTASPVLFQNHVQMHTLSINLRRTSWFYFQVNRLISLLRFPKNPSAIFVAWKRQDLYTKCGWFEHPKGFKKEWTWVKIRPSRHELITSLVNTRLGTLTAPTHFINSTTSTVNSA